jgi:hydrogenase-4 component E
MSCCSSSCSRNFWVLGTTRLSSMIRAAAVQGLLLAALPIALYPHASLHIVGLAIGTLLVKAIVLPHFLTRAIREAAVRREIEPLIGFTRVPDPGSGGGRVGIRHRAPARTARHPERECSSRSRSPR